MTSGNLVSKAVSGLAWGAVASGIQACAQLLMVAFFARMFAPAELGLVAVGMVLAGAACLCAQAGLPQAIVQKPDLGDREVGAALLVITGTALATACLIWTCADVLSAAMRLPGLAPVLRPLAVGVVLRSVAGPAEALLQRDLQFATLAWIEVVTYGVGFGLVGCMAAVLSGDIRAIPAAYVAQALLRCVALMYCARTHLPRSFSLAPVRRLMHFGFGQSCAQASNLVATEADNAIVGVTLGPAAAGLYSRAYQLVVAPANALGLLLDRVAFPMLARVQRDTALVGHAYLTGSAALSLVCFPLTVILFLTAHDIGRLVLGPGWDGVAAPLQVLALGLFMRTAFQLSDSVCRSLGAVYSSGRRQIVYAAAVLAGASIGSAGGVQWVAAGVVAAMTLKYVLMTELTLRLARTTLRQYLDAVGPGVVQGVAVCAAGLLCGQLLPAPPSLTVGDALGHLALVLGTSALAMTAVGWQQASRNQIVRELFAQLSTRPRASQKPLLEVV